MPHNALELSRRRASKVSDNLMWLRWQGMIEKTPL
jgi:hypothetical protein